MAMELRNIVTVKKIIETGSYQAAARDLNYAQSTITFQVKQLEDELGVKLFERHGSGMRLTSQGEELLPSFDRVLESVEQLRAASVQGSSPRGSLKISLPESLVTYKMQPVLAAFKKAASDVRLSLHVKNCYAIYDEVIEGSADLAIHYDVAEYPEGIVSHELGTYPLVLVGSPDLTDVERDFLTSGQRKRVCHIQNDPNALYLRIWNAYLAERDITLDPEMELWSIESVKRSVASGLGVAYLPRFCVEEELNSGELIEIPTAIKGGTMTAICVYDGRRWMSPAAELFIRILNEHFDKEASAGATSGARTETTAEAGADTAAEADPQARHSK